MLLLFNGKDICKDIEDEGCTGDGESLKGNKRKG